ncbi:hypothetical protein BCR33DRAFT_847554 [Rhizoclosmatium globosum]|uniref:CUB domain-containing protein n=1 Tax=Rhizoclosmatium globosum TaxID=329046 RepID=A0A1Y2CTE2_9FUNG|nr:hypothetical protein BCR33DRAFT_847554 [Rhizoclosmatium globosum]|eukprot:ORY49625.1 hypothetical protein BCR33DRAFT_847554 [Rhizoclosmatium globosum]
MLESISSTSVVTTAIVCLLAWLIVPNQSSSDDREMDPKTFPSSATRLNARLKKMRDQYHHYHTKLEGSNVWMDVFVYNATAKVVTIKFDLLEGLGEFGVECNPNTIESGSSSYFTLKRTFSARQFSWFCASYFGSNWEVISGYLTMNVKDTAFSAFRVGFRFGKTSSGEVFNYTGITATQDSHIRPFEPYPPTEQFCNHRESNGKNRILAETTTMRVFAFPSKNSIRLIIESVDDPLVYNTHSKFL